MVVISFDVLDLLGFLTGSDGNVNAFVSASVQAFVDAFWQYSMMLA